jgi:pimeloyl-ACP methyl ester carboxylesterase
VSSDAASPDSRNAGTVVLVHGAFHGRWCWDRVVSLLGAAGVRTVAVELPFTSFKDDVNCVRTAIAQVGTPVVLCGHSYGGAVITEAGNEQLVGQLAYLCAFAVAEGYSTARPADEPLPRTGLPVGLRVADDGVATFNVSLARDTFYGDCEPADVELACARLRPMAADGLTAPVTRAAWRNVPSLYAVCTNDMAIHPTRRDNECWPPTAARSWSGPRATRHFSRNRPSLPTYWSPSLRAWLLHPAEGPEWSEKFW